MNKTSADEYLRFKKELHNLGIDENNIDKALKENALNIGVFTLPYNKVNSTE